MPYYMGQCDKLRRTAEGEKHWEEIMSNKRQISESLFLEHANIENILDDGETWEEYKSGTSDDLKFYCSTFGNNDVVFFKLVVLSLSGVAFSQT